MTEMPPGSSSVLCSCAPLSRLGWLQFPTKLSLAMAASDSDSDADAAAAAAASLLPAPIHLLPPDALHNVLLRLPLRDAVVCRPVSRLFHETLSHNFLALLPSLRLLLLRHPRPEGGGCLHAFDPDRRTGSAPLLRLPPQPVLLPRRLLPLSPLPLARVPFAFPAIPPLLLLLLLHRLHRPPAQIARCLQPLRGDLQLPAPSRICLGAPRHRPRWPRRRRPRAHRARRPLLHPIRIRQVDEASPLAPLQAAEPYTRLRRCRRLRALRCRHPVAQPVEALLLPALHAHRRLGPRRALRVGRCLRDPQAPAPPRWCRRPPCPDDRRPQVLVRHRRAMLHGAHPTPRSGHHGVGRSWPHASQYVPLLHRPL
nr:F-box domain-containing protein [Oryza sativa Japonica Group]